MSSHRASSSAKLLAADEGEARLSVLVDMSKGVTSSLTSTLDLWADAFAHAHPQARAADATAFATAIDASRRATRGLAQARAQREEDVITRRSASLSPTSPRPSL